MEGTYLPADEWRERVETWRKVSEWYAARGHGHGANAPDPDGGVLEEIRARMNERQYRELVIPWYAKHGTDL